MNTKGWHLVTPLVGPRSRGAVALILVLGIGWLTWPVWQSSTAPGIDDMRALLPALLAALGGLLLVLGWALWRDAGRQVAVFAPVVALSGIGTLVRLLCSPSAAGIQPSFAVPLLAGAALGGPAGFAVGALSCLVSSVLLGLVQTPLVAQTLVWGIWGLAGGLCLRVGHRVAPLLLALLSCALGPLSGVLLNLTGWVDDAGVERGAFLLGAAPTESAVRLVEYSLATSLPIDSVRGCTAALVVVCCAPVLGALRDVVHDRAPSDRAPSAPRPRFHPSDAPRRERSDRAAIVWNDHRGEHP